MDADVAKTILTGRQMLKYCCSVHGPNCSVVDVVCDAEFASLEPKTRKWAFRLGHDDTFTKRFPAVAKIMKLESA